MILTTQQQDLVNQIQLLAQQLQATSDQHYTLQQYFGLEDTDEL